MLAGAVLKRLWLHQHTSTFAEPTNSGAMPIAQILRKDSRDLSISMAQPEDSRASQGSRVSDGLRWLKQLLPSRAKSQQQSTERAQKQKMSKGSQLQGPCSKAHSVELDYQQSQQQQLLQQELGEVIASFHIVRKPKPASTLQTTTNTDETRSGAEHISTPRQGQSTHSAAPSITFQAPSLHLRESVSAPAGKHPAASDWAGEEIIPDSTYIKSKTTTTTITTGSGPKLAPLTLPPEPALHSGPSTPHPLLAALAAHEQRTPSSRQPSPRRSMCPVPQTTSRGGRPSKRPRGLVIHTPAAPDEQHTLLHAPRDAPRVQLPVPPLFELLAGDGAGRLHPHLELLMATARCHTSRLSC